MAIQVTETHRPPGLIRVNFRPDGSQLTSIHRREAVRNTTWLGGRRKKGLQVGKKWTETKT